MNETKRKPFAVWTVGETDYRLKLDTATIAELETKFKCNLLNLLESSGSMPALSVMLTVVHGAMKKFNHGITYKEVQILFDQYLDEGGSQVAFLSDVVLPVYQVSGFFSEAQTEVMDSQMAEVRENI